MAVNLTNTCQMKNKKIELHMLYSVALWDELLKMISIKVHDWRLIQNHIVNYIKNLWRPKLAGP